MPNRISRREMTGIDNVSAVDFEVDCVRNISCSRSGFLVRLATCTAAILTCFSGSFVHASDPVPNALQFRQEINGVEDLDVARKPSSTFWHQKGGQLFVFDPEERGWANLGNFPQEAGRVWQLTKDRYLAISRKPGLGVWLCSSKSVRSSLLLERPQTGSIQVLPGKPGEPFFILWTYGPEPYSCSPRKSCSELLILNPVDATVRAIASLTEQLSFDRDSYKSSRDTIVLRRVGASIAGRVEINISDGAVVFDSYDNEWPQNWRGVSTVRCRSWEHRRYPSKWEIPLQTQGGTVELDCKEKKLTLRVGDKQRVLLQTTGFFEVSFVSTSDPRFLLIRREVTPGVDPAITQNPSRMTTDLHLFDLNRVRLSSLVDSTPRLRSGFLGDSLVFWSSNSLLTLYDPQSRFEVSVSALTSGAWMKAQAWDRWPDYPNTVLVEEYSGSSRQWQFVDWPSGRVLAQTPGFDGLVTWVGDFFFFAKTPITDRWLHTLHEFEVVAPRIRSAMP